MGISTLSRATVLAILILLAVTACADAVVAPGPTPTESSPVVPNPTPSATPTPAFLDPDEVPPLTLGDVFPPRDLEGMRLDTDELRTIIATGDVIPARHTDVVIRQRGDDFLYPVSATSEITLDADVTVANLEAPIIEACPYHDSGFTFCGRPGFVGALEAAGVDVVTLENNHIGNYGFAGIDETIGYLKAAGMKWADREKAAISNVRGVKFGFLALNGVGEAIDRQAMTDRIRALDANADVVAVAIHWGAEYERLPQPAPGIAPDDPIEIAHAAVDAGADLVIGNHPHWVQAVELYKGKFIAYAHGNFIFDQMWSYETRVGVIGKYTFYGDRLVRVQFIPTLIEDFAQPAPMRGEERKAVLREMRVASEELAELMGGR